jgi:hypothetical protein
LALFLQSLAKLPVAVVLLVGMALAERLQVGFVVGAAPCPHPNMVNGRRRSTAHPATRLAA